MSSDKAKTQLTQLIASLTLMPHVKTVWIKEVNSGIEYQIVPRSGYQSVPVEALEGFLKEEFSEELTLEAMASESPLPEFNATEERVADVSPAEDIPVEGPQPAANHKPNKPGSNRK